MTITYPLTFPSKVPARLVKRPKSFVSGAPSIFTGESQIQAHQGQQRQFDVIMPPMKGDDALDFEAFLLKLNGKEGYLRG